MKSLKKGSTLISVLMVSTVLIIICVALITLSLSSLKVRKLNEEKKISLYSSESGIDEALEIIDKYTKNAVSEGNLAVEKYNEDIERIIEVEKYILLNSLTDINKTKKTEKGLKITDEIKLRYIDGNGNINKEKLSSERNEIFKKGYKRKNLEGEFLEVYKKLYSDSGSKIIGYYDSETGIDIEKGYDQYIIGKTPIIKNEIENKKELVINKDGKVEFFVTIKDSKGKVISNPYSLPYIISIDSKYNYENVEREVCGDFKINIAEYNVSYNPPYKLNIIPKEPISNALICEKNMIFNCGKVVFKVDNKDEKDRLLGNVYVKGGNKNDEISGILLEGNSSELSINGQNMITPKDVVISNSKEFKSLNNVYSKNFIIDKKSLDGKAYIDGALYLLDDLELNGLRGSINVKNGFYGVSDGTISSDNASDKSSSININDLDYKGIDINANEGESIIIAGTSYITLSKENSYQTGESVSVKGNFRAYTEPLDIKKEDELSYKDLDKSNVIFKFMDGLNLAYSFVDGNNIDKDGINAILEAKDMLFICDNSKTYYAFSLDDNKKYSMGSRVYVKNVTPNSKISIKLYKKNENGEEVSESKTLTVIKGKLLNVFDKSNYFKKYVELYGKNDLEIGLSDEKGKKGIKLSGDILTTGIVLNNGEVISSSWNLDKENTIKARRIMLKNKLFYMGFYERYKGLDFKIDDIKKDIYLNDNLTQDYFDLDEIMEPKVMAFGSMNSEDKDIYKLIDLTKIDEKTYTSDRGKAIKESLKSPNIIINKDSSKTLYLKGDNGENVAEDDKTIVKDIPNKTSIIISKGDIKISGKVDFKGVIICGGNIEFIGNEDKTISYDAKGIRELVLSNSDLFSEIFNRYSSRNKDDFFIIENYLSGGVYSINIPLVSRVKWQLIK